MTGDAGRGTLPGFCVREIMTKPRKWLLRIASVFAAGFILLNIAAYHHARSMMFFSRGGVRTERPEQLSLAGKFKILATGITLPRPVTDLAPSALAPDCREIGIPCPGLGLLSAWYVDRGAQTPLVVMFHGYGAEKTCMRFEAGEFLNMGASVLLVDFRGCGASPGELTTIGYLEGEDVAAVARHVREKLPHSRMVLFGQSMGAAAILRAIATQGVHPDAVILEAVFDTMLNTIGNRFHTMGLPSFPAARLLLFWAGVQCGFNGFDHRPMEYARSLRCPSLFLHGRHDPRTTIADGRRVFVNAAGPKSFVIFENAAHLGFAGAEPAGWRASVRPLVSGGAFPPQP